MTVGHGTVFFPLSVFVAYPSTTIDQIVSGISRAVRELSPAHYTLKIESYTRLSKAKGEKYESGVFKAGGYNWRLILYPNGNQKSDGSGHISLYLAIDDSNPFPNNNWEIFADFKLFVLNQKENLYLAIQDGVVRRFHHLKKEWGFGKLLSLETFKEDSCGHLIQDSCVFGAEVFVIHPTGRVESLSLAKGHATRKPHRWKLPNFSTLDDRDHYSDPFTAGGRKWQMLICPKGYDSAKGSHLLFYLSLKDWKSLPTKRKVYAEYKMRVRDHPGINKMEETVRYWFSRECSIFGFQKFIPLDVLYEVSNGYLISDTLIVEVEILAVSVVKLQG